MLIIDTQTGEAILEKISNTVQLKAVRWVGPHGFLLIKEQHDMIWGLLVVQCTLLEGNKLPVDGTWQRAEWGKGCLLFVFRAMVKCCLSLVPSPSLLPLARRSGPRSRIPWAYSRNVVRTNEIAGLVIITFWNAITER